MRRLWSGLTCQRFSKRRLVCSLLPDNIKPGAALTSQRIKKRRQVAALYILCFHNRERYLDCDANHCSRPMP
jgi:hypothetical protein